MDLLPAAAAITVEEGETAVDVSATGVCCAPFSAVVRESADGVRAIGCSSVVVDGQPDVVGCCTSDVKSTGWSVTGACVVVDGKPDVGGCTSDVKSTGWSVTGASMVVDGKPDVVGCCTSDVKSTSGSVAVSNASGPAIFQ